DHADDLAPRSVLVRPPGDPPTDRILAWEVSVGSLSSEHDDQAPLLDVALVELTPADERNAHHLEVSRRHDIELETRLRARRERWTALDLEPSVAVHRLDGHRSRGGDVGDAGLSRDLREHGLEEPIDRCRVVAILGR